MSPIPPQFLKGKKPANDDATEPKSQDNPQEDALEGPMPTGHSSAKAPAKGGKKAHPNAKKAMLLASLKKG